MPTIRCDAVRAPGRYILLYCYTAILQGANAPMLTISRRREDAAAVDELEHHIVRAAIVATPAGASDREAIEQCPSRRVPHHRHQPAVLCVCAVAVQERSDDFCSAVRQSLCIARACICHRRASDRAGWRRGRRSVANELAQPREHLDLAQHDCRLRAAHRLECGCREGRRRRQHRDRRLCPHCSWASLSAGARCGVATSARRKTATVCHIDIVSVEKIRRSH